MLAGLCAKGFGAFDIGLRDPGVGALESWSGYFHPLNDTPFKNAVAATLRANDPELLLRGKAKAAAPARRPAVRLDEPPAQPLGAAAGEHRDVPTLPCAEGHWLDEVRAGLSWTFGV